MRSPVLAAALTASLALAPAATAHRIELAEARRIVADLALGVVTQAAAGFNEIRSGESRSEAKVACRRLAEHLARCTWRASLASNYGGLAPGIEEAALVCAGGAVVTLDGRRTVARITSRSCHH